MIRISSSQLLSEISAVTGKKYGEQEKSGYCNESHSRPSQGSGIFNSRWTAPIKQQSRVCHRRILRRAVRYGYNYLGTEDPFIYRLVPVLAEIMGDQYPELRASEEHISKIILEEETAFLKTLGKGLKMIGKMISDLKNEKKNVLPGKIAFELYDTFGFPVDLTQLILKENGMTLDIEGFENEMKGQKESSREDADA